ncbi:MAG: hypothetical protein LBJ11_04605 [Oscillospiraceae bacterium]|jgi:cyclic beta-1,2-glucan synthetase|nr:hypothetical protein [Oscillospiraceae bacterium]
MKLQYETAKDCHSQLSRGLRQLRQCYREALRRCDGRTGKQGSAVYDEWLCDNFYMLEREARTVQQELTAMVRHGGLAAESVRRVGEFCAAACPEGELPAQEALTRAMEDANLSAEAAEWTPPILRWSLLMAAAESVGAPAEAAVRLLSNAVQSFRTLPDVDFGEILEQVSPAERLLAQDPAGTYLKMEESSRANYRRLLANLARRRGQSMEATARGLLEAAKRAPEGTAERHVGTHLLAEAYHPGRGKALLWAETLLPLGLGIFAAVLLRQWTCAVLLYLPLWALARVLLEGMFLRGVVPLPLPRLALQGKIPPEGRTLITVSTLLPEAAKAATLRKRMEELRFSNGGPNVTVCVLADLRGADTPQLAQDGADIAAACREIQALNRAHGGGFLLAVRPRVYSPTQDSYTGWERKRGAITELVRCIRGGGEEGFLALCGDKAKLREVKFLLALDADTQLPLDTLPDMVGAALHPCNRPVFDERLGRVTRGYGILAPQVGLDVESTMATPFAHSMAGEGGISPYDSSVAERYQDLFGCGIFAGKGLIDVAAFAAVTQAHEFPPEQVLSHDILEGGYLRAGFLADVQVTDGFPARQASYCTRLERWVRGDWQNIIFLKKKYRLGRLARYQLFDNLRRSMLGPGCLAALLWSLALPLPAALTLGLAAVLGMSGGYLIPAARSLAHGGISMLSRLYYSGGLPAALGDTVRAALQLTMLAQAAWISLAAMARGLWRTFVSRKHLLDWTTAAQGDAARSGLKAWLTLWPTAVSAGLLLAFGGAGHRLAALLLLADLVFAPLSARKTERRATALRPAEEERLQGYCAAMWNYFDTACTEEHHYLPPDNIQETPVFRVAARTSPTNLGLALLCILAARDFGFLDSEEMARRLDRMVRSIERLERWNGHLLNWYDTRSLRPLEPRYVSTVDSGNFLICVTALAQGLAEYQAECPALAEIRGRLLRLREGCDLRALYHPRRRLFHIGIDISDGKPSPSYYDLLMSEARMTGYYAIARREIPKKHWGALGRTLARQGRFTGPVSWTGTMFEYFMPYLFLPTPEGTLGYEALRFCLSCQRRRARQGRISVPWGISESGFYAFDNSLNYQYKAHGVQKLGLRRGLNEELVAAPYASFLAMQMAPRSAMENLRQFEKMELLGRCGFYEAADFTASRTGGQDYAVVRSYMAHHVGMSFLAALNVLRDGVLRRRFLADPEMGSAQSLLEERIPDGAAVFRDEETREAPRPREHVVPARRELTEIHPARPAAQLLTNGEWSCVMTDTGASVSLYRGISIFRHDRDLLRRACGVFAFLREDGGRAASLSAAPDFADPERHRAVFDRAETVHQTDGGRVTASVQTQVHPRLPAEQRVYTLKNKSKRAVQGSLLVYFEPSLTGIREEAEHPAFSRLFLLDSYDPVQQLLSFTRSRRDGSGTLTLAAGFGQGTKVLCERSRERVRRRDRALGRVSLEEVARERLAAGEDSGRGNPDCCGAFEVPYRLNPGESRELVFYLCAATTRDEAAAMLLRLRRSGPLAAGEGGPSPFRQGEMATALAESILPRLFFFGGDGEDSLAARGRNRRGRSALWPMGISGDVPILYVPIHGPEETARALPYLTLHRRLRAAGIPCDVALGFREGGAYDTPISTALAAALRREGSEHLAGERGGVHLINLNRVGADAAAALEAYAVTLAPTEGERFAPSLPLPGPARRIPLHRGKGSAGEIPAGALRCGAGYFREDGAFVIPKTEEIPAAPWCLPLCNRSFGTLVSESSLGFTWAVNARENKLSPWENDPCTDNIGELLLLRLGDTVYDMVRGASAEFTPAQARWQGEMEGIWYEIRVRVPAKGCAKRCELRMQNSGPTEKAARLAYYLEPVLGTRRDEAAHLCGEILPDGALLHSPAAAVPGYLALLLPGGADFVCCDRARFFGGDWRGGGSLPQADPCAAVGRELRLAPGQEVFAEFSLSWGAKRNAALCAHLVAEDGETARAKLRVETPDLALNHMINTWLPHQILAARLFGRTGFSQCGGAWGFRDQLQDVAALIPTHPQLAKVQIARCAAVQFPEGDVLHWWHRIPGDGVRGVRTRYSDDLLWLPYVCAEYVEQTGDAAFLDAQIPFRDGAPLGPEEHERYQRYGQTREKASLYDHCLRALDRVSLGERGLPCIGGGDWNDGFNLVGIRGKGESVWLAEFLVMVLEKTAGLCARRKEPARAEEYRLRAARVREDIDREAWAGDRYLRAFWDDGTPLGAAECPSCAIDSLPQSFAALSGLPNESRRNRALDTAVEQLADRRHGMIRLLREPFAADGKRAGYINAYPPGIRENGGQYTHAAVWLCMALLREGRTDEGWELLRMLNPAGFCQDQDRMRRYRAEPFALAGDVCGAAGIEGRAGWTLYTGAAAWYYRAVLEGIFGLRMRDGEVAWEPKLPKNWETAALSFSGEGSGRKSMEAAALPQKK